MAAAVEDLLLFKTKPVYFSFKYVAIDERTEVRTEVSSQFYQVNCSYSLLFCGMVWNNAVSKDSYNHCSEVLSKL